MLGGLLFLLYGILGVLLLIRNIDMVIRKQSAEKFQQPGVKGRKYDSSDLLPDNSFVYGELDGEHGERVTTSIPRLYYILEGKGKFQIDDKVYDVSEGDLAIIPPNTKYNYFSEGGIMKFVLFMEKH